MGLGARVDSINEAMEKQRQVMTCEAECEGKPVPTAPSPGCADLCVKATACEVNLADKTGFQWTYPGITADLFDCTDKCNFNRPLSGEDISCWSEQDCSILGEVVRRMKPGECPG